MDRVGAGFNEIPGKLTKAEGVLLAVAAVIWLLFFSLTPPLPGSTDVYCFRDPAVNFLHHEGFRTASYVLSQSFQPVLYSINTPASSWAYMPFGAIWGVGGRSAEIYALTLAFLADCAFVVLLLRLFQPGFIRLALLFLLAVVAPLGIVNSQLDRPENLSFVLLLALLLVLRRPSTGKLALAGFLSGLAFLVEPITGVWAAGLTGGAILFQFGTEDRSATPAKLTREAIFSAAFFALPIVLTIAAFHAADPTSIHRFLHHTDYVLARGAEAEVSGGKMVAAPPPHSGVFLARYQAALSGIAVMGPGIWIQVAGFVAIALIWLIASLSRGVSGRSRLAFVLLGLMFLLLPIIVFPAQRNYLMLSTCVFPFAVAWNWCGAGAFTRKPGIKLIAALNLLVLGPSILIDTAHGLESGTSYRESVQQAGQLQAYLKAHHAENGIVLVPAYQYYIYKPVLSNLYNPFYLSPEESPTDITAVVNCNTSSPYFKPASRPLPDFVSGEKFNLISSGQQQVKVTLLGHPIMSKNWTWSCDVYARP